jgi:Collagen triple helix repeat (20 copies)
VRLSGWQSIAVVALAVILLGIAVADRLDRNRSCSGADTKLNDGFPAAAEKKYTEVLTDDSDEECAVTGMRNVVAQRCKQADLLRGSDADDEAEKRYVALIDKEPSHEEQPVPECVLTGLKAIAEKQPTATATATAVVIKGAKGDQGDKGDKGSKGDPGGKGDQGDPGDKGDPGEQGDKGDKGNAGDPGQKGDKGDKGDNGDTGGKGATGDTGGKGDKGDKGDAGPKGAKGDKGDRGARGRRGPRGEAGTSRPFPG